MKENEMVTSKFTKATKYDTGKNPCVATIGTNNKIVEVHEGNGTLWYHVGTLQKDGTIAWKPSTQYDTGSNPAVAAYTNEATTTIIEIHQGNDKLWYHVGTLRDDDTISFGNSTPYDKGVTPAIALFPVNHATLKVIELHQSQDADTLWYHVGLIKNGTIDWSTGESTKYDTGSHPALAVYMTPTDSGIIEVHQGNGTLWYHVGILQNTDIQFGDSVKYDTGSNPSICCFSDKTVLDVHENNSTLWCHIGTLEDDKTITWYNTMQYDTGTMPFITEFLDENPVKQTIETHQSENEDTLWSNTGILFQNGFYVLG